MESQHQHEEEHSCCHGEHSHAVTSAKAAKYFCPMCDGVVSDKPGACPMCGMALERNPAYVEAKSYTCPMHPEVRKDHPGECPICGMALEPVAGEVEEENGELKDMSRRFWIGLALTIPVFVLAMGAEMPGFYDFYHTLGWKTVAWSQLILSTPVVVWAGAPFFVRGWRSLVTLHLNMFTLIAVGTGTAYIYSVMVVVFPRLFAFPRSAPPSWMGGYVLNEHVLHEPAFYFESASVITVLVLLGQVLELKARAATGTAIKALLNLAPKTARRVNEDGGEVDVPVEDVHVGDRLRLRPGEKVPVDGSVIEGQSAIDEAMVTGEPNPVAKEKGSSVTAGTINGTGTLVMKAEKVGSDTLLARIVSMVGAAQRSRAPIQRVADTVAGYFVPTVMACAALTFIVWVYVGSEPRFTHALISAVAVLIIACPCALGLATPMSIMVGVGRGARLGVLVKDAEALETLEKIKVLAIDKTGTLTEGRPILTKVIATEEGTAARRAAATTEEELLRVAASVEAMSEHPLAAAIVAGAKKRNIAPLPVEDFKSITGQGVSGRVEGQRVTVGRVETGVPDALAEQAAALRKDGETVFFVEVNGTVAGLLSVTDPIKASSAAAVTALHELGIKVVMLTGDHTDTAKRVADALGIDQVEAGVTPERKHDVVRKLKESGARVAMAGDGVNDAPALAAADVGIAMGTGTDVAIESAGITLVKGDLSGLVRAIQLSRATMQNIRLNLFFAFIYNGVGIPVAAGVFYPVFGWTLSPMVASAAMALSSVSVIGNSLRLRGAVRE